jgi:hypothetical protein
MLEGLVEELSQHGVIALLGLLSGSAMTWAFARWKRHQQRQSILQGDARDTIVIHQHLVETAAEPTSGGEMRKVAAKLRIRSRGQAEMDRVVPNGHLASELLGRALQVTPRDTLISMEGAEGSYLLETLTDFVSDRVANAPFEHDLFVMAPCCEPAGLAEHQPIAILLIPIADLALFESWPACRNIEVEHGGDGARVLTLMEMARRFRQEQEKIAALRKAGQRTRYVETMYILDLALDKRFALVPTRKVPWGRFEKILKQLNLE